MMVLVAVVAREAAERVVVVTAVVTRKVAVMVVEVTRLVLLCLRRLALRSHGVATECPQTYMHI